MFCYYKLKIKKNIYRFTHMKSVISLIYYATISLLTGRLDGIKKLNTGFRYAMAYILSIHNIPGNAEKYNLDGKLFD